MKIFQTVTCSLICLCVFYSGNGQAETQPAKQFPSKIKTVTIELSDHAAYIINGKKFTLGEAIRMVLENNRDTLTGAYEVAMSDSEYLKLKGK